MARVGRQSGKPNAPDPVEANNPFRPSRRRQLRGGNRLSRLKTAAVKVEQAAPPAFEHCARTLKNFASAPSSVAAFRADVTSTQRLTVASCS
jgi:hypothetical protein